MRVLALNRRSLTKPKANKLEVIGPVLPQTARVTGAFEKTTAGNFCGMKLAHHRQNRGREKIAATSSRENARYRFRLPLAYQGFALKVAICMIHPPE